MRITSNVHSARQSGCVRSVGVMGRSVEVMFENLIKRWKNAIIEKERHISPYRSNGLSDAEYEGICGIWGKECADMINDDMKNGR